MLILIKVEVEGGETSGRRSDEERKCRERNVTSRNRKPLEFSGKAEVRLLVQNKL